jgi:hypothetical protein
MIPNMGILKLLFLGGAICACVISLAAQESHSPKRESAFACDRLALAPEARQRHFDELGPALYAIRKGWRELPDGYEFQFPSDAASYQQVAEWTAGERLCCPFFDIDLRSEREGGALWLRLTGRAGVKQFIRSDFARWFEARKNPARIACRALWHHPSMSTPETFPYETRLNILHGPLELIDVHAVARGATHKWFNQTLCQVNDSVVRMAAIQGEYHWHKHDADDEFFYVVEGELLIDLEGKTVSLAPGHGYVVPKGVVHRTRAPEKTVILMVENAGIIPTGD